MRKRLTHAGIAKMVCPTRGRIEHGDSQVNGLYLRLSSTGRKSFVLFYRCNGKPHRRVIGQFDRRDPHSLSKARTEAHRIREDAAVGHMPDDPTITTFGDLAELYMEKEVPKLVRPEERANLIRKQILPAWKDRHLSALRRGDLTSLTDAALESGRPAAANRIFEVVQRLFNWAQARGDIAANPFIKMPPPAKKRARDRVLEMQEIRKLWRAWDDLDDHSRAILRLLLLSGQRRGEVVGMRWSEIDTENRIWTIPAERTKARREHVVPLSDLAMQALNSLPVAGDYVFPGRTGGPMSITHLKKAADRDVKLEQPYTLHDLRRSVATGLARDCGVSDFNVARILNHARQGITGQVYNRYRYLPEKKAALDAWADRIREIVR